MEVFPQILKNLWSVFHAEFNSRKFGLLNIQVRLVNITYKYAKEIFDCNRMLLEMPVSKSAFKNKSFK